VSCLAEFYASVREVDDLLEAWITTGEDHNNYNIWNVLMHKAQHSLRIGASIVREFCPSRQYDACSPASGTLGIKCRSRTDLHPMPLEHGRSIPRTFRTPNANWSVAPFTAGQDS